MNTRQRIKSLLGDDAVIFQRNGNIKVKQHYFYTHGRNEDILAVDIRHKLAHHDIEIEVISKSNHYNSWPKDSWHEVIFKVI